MVQKVIKELDKIRRQSGITEKGSKRLIVKNSEDLKEEEEAKPDSYLKQSEYLRKAYGMKEELRTIFERVITVEEGKSEIARWLKKAERSYSDAIRTIRNHLEGICQYFANRVTSGIMEGINNRIKVIKRQGYGFINIANFRAQLLAAFWP